MNSDDRPSRERLMIPEGMHKFENQIIPNRKVLPVIVLLLKSLNSRVFDPSLAWNTEFRVQIAVAYIKINSIGDYSFAIKLIDNITELIQKRYLKTKDPDDLILSKKFHNLSESYKIFMSQSES